MSKTGVNRVEVPHYVQVWECPHLGVVGDCVHLPNTLNCVSALALIGAVLMALYMGVGGGRV